MWAKYRKTKYSVKTYKSFISFHKYQSKVADYITINIFFRFNLFFSIILVGNWIVKCSR